MRRLTTALALSLLGSLYLMAPPARAQAPEAQTGSAGIRTDTPSGYPVPRFVGLKNARTFCRAGPSFDHPVVITYLKAGTPLLVVAETIDHWRKVRDIDGAECWAHQTTLRASSHVIAIQETLLYARPDVASAIKARLAPGVMAHIDRIDGGWTKISADGSAGWAETRRLWGVQGHIAPHN